MPEHVKENIEGFPDEWLMEVTSSKRPNYVVESKFFNGTVRPFVLPEHDKIASNTFGSVSMSMNDTTFNQAAVSDVTLWSAELHMIHHKIGKDCFPMKKVK
uniref:RNA2 polyprotein n=2 Tax=Lygus hesperus TaxID=30085 RepID=A0A0A9XKJ0_LYGHE